MSTAFNIRVPGWQIPTTPAVLALAKTQAHPFSTSILGASLDSYLKPTYHCVAQLQCYPSNKAKRIHTNKIPSDTLEIRLWPVQVLMKQKHICSQKKKSPTIKVNKGRMMFSEIFFLHLAPTIPPLKRLSHSSHSGVSGLLQKMNCQTRTLQTFNEGHILAHWYPLQMTTETLVLNGGVLLNVGEPKFCSEQHVYISCSLL